MSNNTKKIIISGVIVLAIVIIVSMSTYAWLSWSSSNINIGGQAECFEVNYTKNGDIGSDDNPAQFSLANSYSEGLSSSLDVSLNNTCGITNGTGKLYLNTDTTVTSSVLLSNNILKYQVLDGTTEVASGSVTSTSKLLIYDNIPITTTSKTITVYLWIDGDNVTNSNISDVLTSSYKGNISLEIESGDK